MAERPRNFSKSANRALEVLAYLASVRRPARAAEIADALGLARSSADQLLKTMAAGGYLAISAEDTSYFPSIRLAGFGQWVADCYPEAAKLREIVQVLHDETGETVTLTIENDCYMQVMAHADRGRTGLDVGFQVPVVGSAVGGAALTTKTQRQIGQLVRRARAKRAMLDFQGLGPLLERVRLFRQVGYSALATPPMARPSGLWSIAVTAPALAGARSLVLGLAGPIDEVRPRESQIVHLMRRELARRFPAVAA